MKLLFDQNLSPALVQKLADLFPGSTHTELAGLGRSDDASIWEFCQREGFVIVSKDNDFGFLAMQRGTPPKAICIRLGNCTTQDVENAIRRDVDEIRSFGKNPEVALLILLQPH
jgi:predicted nuclease of predicted toxin-antitoxin system